MKKIVINLIPILLLLIYSCKQLSEPPVDEEISLDLGPVITTHQSLNNGTNWKPLSKLPEMQSNKHVNVVYDFAVNNSEIFCVSNFEGVFSSRDNGLSWTKSNSGLVKVFSDLPYEVFKVSAVVKIGGKFLCSATNMLSEFGIYEFDKESTTWIKKKTWTTKGEVYSLAVSKNGYLFAGVSEENSSSVWYSTDAGNSWNNISGNLPNTIGNIFSFAFKKNEIYIGTSTGIFATKNLGKDWARIYFPYSEVLTLSIDSNGMFYASSRDKAFRKNETNDDWTKIFSVPSGRNVNRLFIGTNNKLFLACCDGLWLSEDNGINLIKVGLDNLLPVRLEFNSNGDLLAATKRSGVFVSPK